MLSDCLPATIRNPSVFSSGRGGEGFFEYGLEEMGGMCARLLDLGFQRPAGRHQRLHSLHNRDLLGKGWKGDGLHEKVVPCDVIHRG